MQVNQKEPKKQKIADSGCCSLSDSSKVSADYLDSVLETYNLSTTGRLLTKTTLEFGENLINLLLHLTDCPLLGKRKIVYYCTFLIKVCELKSATVRSYVSAIKDVLLAIDYKCDQEKLLLSALMGVCKNENDKAPDCLPIRRPLMEQILFEIERKFSEVMQQPYLLLMYKTVIIFYVTMAF